MPRLVERAVGKAIFVYKSRPANQKGADKKQLSQRDRGATPINPAFGKWFIAQVNGNGNQHEASYRLHGYQKRD